MTWRRRSARRPTYANVTATIALVVALGGTSWAATQLPLNSVGSRQLQPDSVTGGKVRDRSLTLADFAGAASVIGSRGPRGPLGPAGPSGAVGPAGGRGPSDAFMDSPAGKGLSTQANVGTVVAKLVDVPAGRYVLSSIAQVGDFTNLGAIVSCDIKVNGNQAAGTSAVIGSGSGSARVSVLSATATVTQASTFQVTLECRPDQSLAQPPGVLNQHLSAIAVNALHVTPG